MQNFWGICAPRALGASLHQKLLGYLCTRRLSEHLHMQNLWGVSAPGISGLYPNTKLLGYHCTSGAFLRPKLLGPRALGASLTEISWDVSHPEPLRHLAPRTSEVSLHSEPLEHLTPKTSGVSHALGSGALGPQAELQGVHSRGVPEPRRLRPIRFPRPAGHPTPPPPRAPHHPINPPPVGPQPSSRVPGVLGGRRIPTGPLGAEPLESQRAPGPTHVGL